MLILLGQEQEMHFYATLFSFLFTATLVCGFEDGKRANKLHERQEELLNDQLENNKLQALIDSGYCKFIYQIEVYKRRDLLNS